MLLLADTPLEGAKVAAERLRAGIAGRGFSVGVAVTCSFGVAEFRPGDDDTSLVARADQALYQAKRAGRNRVVDERFSLGSDGP